MLAVFADPGQCFVGGVKRRAYLSRRKPASASIARMPGNARAAPIACQAAIPCWPSSIPSLADPSWARAQPPVCAAIAMY